MGTFLMQIDRMVGHLKGSKVEPIKNTQIFKNLFIKLVENH